MKREKKLCGAKGTIMANLSQDCRKRNSFSTLLKLMTIKVLITFHIITLLSTDYYTLLNALIKRLN